MHSAVAPAEILPRSVSPSRKFRAKFVREVSELGLPRGPGSEEPTTEADLVPLPRTAQRYLRFMRVVGRPRVWSFRVGASGLFRRRPDQPWMACEAWQYNTRLDIARIFHMRMRYAGIPLLVRDVYLHGEGRMVAKLFDTFPIVNVADDKIATGELVTYLNDAILLGPSMALGPEVAWGEVDDRSFDVTLTDRGRKVEARVFVDERGAVTDFSTTDRFGKDPSHPGEMVRARWTTPVQGWSLSSDPPRPTGASAVWHFPSGDLEYARFTFGDIEVNVPLAR
jgi:hypothetical protein